ncbi:MAG: diguanylate cyclase [Deferrisomatales bacterium]
MGLDERTLRKIVESIHDGLYLVDRDRTVTYWNRAAERMSGFAASDVIGKSCADDILTHVDEGGSNLCTGMCPLGATLADGVPREAEVYMHHKLGHRIPVSVRVSPLTDGDGTIVGGIELFTDISHHAANRLRVQELEELALLDRLTRLANRTYLEREIASRLEEQKRYAVPFGILLVDIDHFKRVNDTYGHDVGDDVLRFVANTFVSNNRAFDVFGRWGGEEFVGVIRNTDDDGLRAIGDRLRTLVRSSYMAREGGRLQVTVSVGATLARPTDSIGSLLKRADVLLYESKGAGRDRLTLG